MTNEQAVCLMKECAMNGFVNDAEWIFEQPKEQQDSLILEQYDKLYQFEKCIDDISLKYKDCILCNQAKNIGYLIADNKFGYAHYSDIIAAIYVLLVADANIYFLYDESYLGKDEQQKKTIASYFIDELIKEYPKAQKIFVSKEMNSNVGLVVKFFLKSHRDIRHIIYFGDFVIMHNKLDFLKRMNITLHLPITRYIISGYHDVIFEQNVKNGCLWGEKCLELLSGHIMFDLCMDVIVRKLKNLAELIHIDQLTEALSCTDKLYKFCDTCLQADLIDNKLTYDFTRLLK